MLFVITTALSLNVAGFGSSIIINDGVCLIQTTSIIINDGVCLIQATSSMHSLACWDEDYIAGIQQKSQAIQPKNAVLKHTSHNLINCG